MSVQACPFTLTSTGNTENGHSAEEPNRTKPFIRVNKRKNSLQRWGGFSPEAQHHTSADSRQSNAGVDFTLNDSLPGASILILGQDVVIRDSLFANLAQPAAAALSIQGSNVSILNTTFAGNSATVAGALTVSGTSSVLISNCTFAGNKGKLSSPFQFELHPG